MNEPNPTLMKDKSNSSIAMMQKPPPDFKEHKVKSNAEQYYLPKIKDGLPTTVKNLSFLRNQNSFKKTKSKDSPLKDEQNFISVRRSLETSQEDMLAIEYPSQSQINNTINAIGTLQITNEPSILAMKKHSGVTKGPPNQDIQNSLQFFKTELVVHDVKIRSPRTQKLGILQSTQQESNHYPIDTDEDKYLSLEKLKEIPQHKVPFELTTIHKGYESSRRHEKKTLQNP